MRWKKTITMVEAHAEGEVGRIVTSGVIDIPGNTMLEKMNYINEVDDSLRRFLVFEPRGYAQMSTNLIFDSTNKEADISTPFGGYKLSGFGGRDNSLMAHDQYTETKTLWIDISEDI